jgi:dUTP pyrophosphatase
MKLLIKPENDFIRNIYDGHSTFNPGDSGIDLFCPGEVIVSAKTRKSVDLKIKCEAFSINYKQEYEKIFKYINESVDFESLKNNLKALNYNVNNCSYYLYPRSSISKTGLMLSNGTGIIDAGYRGNIIASFYNTSDEDYIIQAGSRLVQICAPNLEEINMEVVNTLTETIRGNGGFGSTG